MERWLPKGANVKSYRSAKRKEGKEERREEERISSRKKSFAQMERFVSCSSSSSRLERDTELGSVVLSICFVFHVVQVLM